jgi:hypothetical protein
MQMDKASKALAQRLPASVPRSFRTIEDHTGIPHSTLHARARGGRSIEAKAQSQQYLTPAEEKAMVDFVLQMSTLGTPVRIKYIPSIAYTVARGRREPTDRLSRRARTGPNRWKNAIPRSRLGRSRRLIGTGMRKTSFQRSSIGFR